MWFTLESTGNVARITNAGVITEAKTLAANKIATLQLR